MVLTRLPSASRRRTLSIRGISREMPMATDTTGEAERSGRRLVP